MSGLRVAIVGAGLMGRWHASAARAAGATVALVIDPDLERAQKIARGAATSQSADDLAGARVDVVHVCTPLATHSDAIARSLDCNAHVIVEKPATRDYDTAVAASEAARRADRLLIPVHQFVHQVGVRQMLAMVAELGPLRHVEFVTCSAGAGNLQAEARDLVAAEIVPHAFSLARAFTDQPVAPLPWRLDRPLPGEWRLSTIAESGCSVAATISLSGRPTFALCRVIGEHGSAEADLFHGFATFEPGSASRSYKMRRPVATGLRRAGSGLAMLAGRTLRREPAYPGLRALVSSAYAAMAGHRPPPFRSDEITDVAAARDLVMALANLR